MKRIFCLILCLSINFSFYSNGEIFNDEECSRVDLGNIFFDSDFTNQETLIQWRSPREYLDQDNLVSSGWSDLHISGSGQFSERLFSEILDAVAVEPENIIIVDLRLESHGFVNGYPVSWWNGSTNDLNDSLTCEEVIEDEIRRLDRLKEQNILQVNDDMYPLDLKVEKVQSEKEFVESYGARYVRLPVLDGHRPANIVIQKYLDFIRSLSKDTRVHYHCRSGFGRTTTFLVMHDMIKNARKISFQDIFSRHYFIGGNNFYASRTNGGRERLKFLMHFYEYCQECPELDVRWVDWLRMRHIEHEI